MPAIRSGDGGIGLSNSCNANGDTPGDGDQGANTNAQPHADQNTLANAQANVHPDTYVYADQHGHGKPLPN
jgi:hypothetical protein